MTILHELKNRIGILRVASIVCLVVLLSMIGFSFANDRQQAAADGNIIYVKHNANGANDGTSWADAYTSLQSAIGTANWGDEIWVAQGVYKPTTGTSRNARFSLPIDVDVYGGFAGTETARTQRDWLTNMTVLSGDLAGDDIIDANGIITDTANIVGDDNVFHVVTAISTTGVLDGFVVTGGKANGGNEHNNGAGLYVQSAPDENLRFSPRLRNLIVIGNLAAGNGGGIYNRESNPQLYNVTFQSNVAAANGGGMYASYSQAALTNVDFRGNLVLSTLVNGGGGLYNDHSNTLLTNVLVSGNQGQYGGGIYNHYSNPVMVNLTLTGNRGIGPGDGVYNRYSSPTLVNSILWGNDTEQMFTSGGSPVVRYSIVQGGYPGNGNSDADPLFMAPRSASGAPTALGDYRLRYGSPAIDVGDDSVVTVSTDLDGNSRQVGRVDMGAYEHQNWNTGDAQGVIYVNHTATGANTGLSWADAYTDLQDALENARDCQVWVVAGVYYPAADASNRTAAFMLKRGVTVYGGFVGNETALSQRDWQVNPTVVSGDLGRDDVTDWSGVTLNPSDIVGDNAYHVVVGSGITVTAVLDGFIITGGQADGTNHFVGGGLYIMRAAAPLLQHLVVVGNLAASGGGMYASYSQAALTNVDFRGNLAQSSSGSSGGGGLYNDYSNTMLTNVAFSGNNTQNYGGGIHNNHSDPIMVNVTVAYNLARTTSGGIYNRYSSPTLVNSIVWGNSGPQIFNSVGSPVVRYSIVQGGYDGEGNLNVNPLFVAPRSTSGAPTALGDYRLQYGSPAIDAGDPNTCPTTDLDGLPRPNDGDASGTSTCDMGAYEAGTMVCSVGLGVHTFTNHPGVTIEVATLGDELGCLYVDEMGTNHANATGTPGDGTMTWRYWLIRGLQSDKTTDATGFEVNLTLPHNLADHTKASVCRYTGSTWDCAQTGSTTTTVWRNGISAFSDWTVGNDVPTAVTLAAFDAAWQGEDVQISWETASELDNLGFNLYRSTSPAGPWTQLNTTLIPAQNPGAVFGATYGWLDTDVTPGEVVYYRLEDVDVYGTSIFHGPIQPAEIDPSVVGLRAFGAATDQSSLLTLTLMLTGALAITFSRWNRRRSSKLR